MTPHLEGYISSPLPTSYFLLCDLPPHVKEVAADEEHEDQRGDEHEEAASKLVGF